LSFEEALLALEQTVEELRSDGLGLARALDLYEQGTRLAAYCEELLTAAELRLSRVDVATGAISHVESIGAREPGEPELEAGW
jgi:exodeoxyribonuclease VII small subunit